MASLNPNDMVNYVGIASKEEFPECPIAYKQFTIIENLYVPRQKPSVEEVNSISASVLIKDTKVIQSPYDLKILVSGIVKQKIIYTADKPDQPLHHFHFDIPFCELIILKEKKPHVIAKPFVEDIHIFHTEKRKIKVCKVICICIIDADCCRARNDIYKEKG